jgi:hypothetical protein
MKDRSSRSLMRFASTKIAALSVAVTLMPSFAEAETLDRPQPPASPVSTEDCDAFRDKFVHFMKAVIARSESCNKASNDARDNSFTEFSPYCGGVKITSHTKCRDQFEAAWCVQGNFEQQLSSCMASVSNKSLERKQFDADMAKNKQNQDKIESQLQRERCGTETIFPNSKNCAPAASSGSGFEEIQRSNDGQKK